jgi:hypothetical protein
MPVELGARAFCFNVDNPADLLKVLEIGTRGSGVSER